MGRRGRGQGHGLESMIAAGAQVALNGFTTELRAAADALEEAAKALRDKAGLGFEANEAYKAALRARDAVGVEVEAAGR